jgi:hypothetical protein
MEEIYYFTTSFLTNQVLDYDGTPIRGAIQEIPNLASSAYSAFYNKSLHIDYAD